MVPSTSQANRHQPVVVAFIIGLIYVIFIAAAMAQDRSAVLVYLRDPAAHFKFSPFAGVISNFGVLVTVSAAAVCAFASAQAKSDAPLLRAIALLTALVALDDLFLLHEDTLPNRLGAPEYLAYVFYAAGALFIGLRFRAQLSNGPLLGLYLATGLLGSSIAIDAMTEFGNAQTVIEDGLKLVGLCVWSVYWILRAHAALAHPTPGAAP